MGTSHEDLCNCSVCHVPAEVFITGSGSVNIECPVCHDFEFYSRDVAGKWGILGIFIANGNKITREPREPRFKKEELQVPEASEKATVQSPSIAPPLQTFGLPTFRFEIKTGNDRPAPVLPVQQPLRVRSIVASPKPKPESGLKKEKGPEEEILSGVQMGLF